MKRILLKLSGEALAGAEKKGFDEATVIAVAKQIRAVAEEGTQIGIVIGGGNFWRGRTSETINRNKADQIGMLATVMNCIYVSDICRYLGLKTEIFTPFVCGAFTKLYSKDAVEEAFAEGKILFFAGGTGHRISQHSDSVLDRCHKYRLLPLQEGLLLLRSQQHAEL